MGVSAFTVSMSSGTSTASFNLGQAWEYVNVIIPTFTSQTRLNFEISDSAAGTYYAMFQPPQNATTTVSLWPFQTPATATSSGFAMPLPFFGTQYLRVRTVDSAPTAAVNIKVLCSGLL